jgi:hypothetical protein
MSWTITEYENCGHCGEKRGIEAQRTDGAIIRIDPGGWSAYGPKYRIFKNKMMYQPIKEVMEEVDRQLPEGTKQ